MTAKLPTYAELDEMLAQFAPELHSISTDNLMEYARRVIYLQNGFTEELKKLSDALEERSRYLNGCLMQIEMHNNTQTQEA